MATTDAAGGTAVAAIVVVVVLVTLFDSSDRFHGVCAIFGIPTRIPAQQATGLFPGRGVVHRDPSFATNWLLLLLLLTRLGQRGRFGFDHETTPAVVHKLNQYLRHFRLFVRGRELVVVLHRQCLGHVGLVPGMIVGETTLAQQYVLVAVFQRLLGSRRW